MSQRENVSEALEELANLFHDGAVYLGTRRDGHNDEYQFGSLMFKVPREPSAGVSREDDAPDQAEADQKRVAGLENLAALMNEQNPDVAAIIDDAAGRLKELTAGA